MKNITSYKTWLGAHAVGRTLTLPPSPSSLLPSSTMPRPLSTEMPRREQTGAGSNYTNFKVGTT